MSAIDIYIDSINGDDTTGDGTKYSPYKTLHETILNKTIKNGQDYNIYLGEGEYTFQQNSGFGYFQNCTVVIIGKQEKTKLIQTTGLWNNSGGGGYNTFTLIFRKLIFNMSATTNQTNYSCFKWNYIWENIVIDQVPNDGYGLILPNGAPMIVRNCLKTKKTNSFFRTTAATISLYDSYGAFTSGYSTSQANWDKSGNEITTTNPQYDNKFRRLDGSEVNGIESGTYRWGWMLLHSNYQNLYPSNIWYTDTENIEIEFNIADIYPENENLKLAYKIELNGNKLYPTDTEYTDYISNPVNIIFTIDKDLINMGDNSLILYIKNESEDFIPLEYTLSKEDRDTLSISRDILFESEWNKTNMKHALEGLTLDLKIKQGYATTNEYSKVNTTGKANINNVLIDSDNDIIEDVYYEDKMINIEDNYWEYPINLNEYNEIKTMTVTDENRIINSLIESDGKYYTFLNGEWIFHELNESTAKEFLKNSGIQEVNNVISETTTDVLKLNYLSDLPNENGVGRLYKREVDIDKIGQIDGIVYREG